MGENPGAEISGRVFVEAMTLPVRQAMAAARFLEGRVANRPKIEEFTPEKAALTDADCVAQEILLVALHDRFPDVALSVEEDTPSALQFRGHRERHTVVIDPIDGTLLYLRGEGRYAVLVGLETEGRVEAAIVGLPTSETVVRAVRGEGSEIAEGKGPFRPAALAPDGDLVLVSQGLPRNVRGRLERRGFELSTAAGGAIGVAPLVEKVAGGLRLSTSRAGLSRRNWVSTLPTLEVGGAVEILEGPFPERYRPGVGGMIVASSKEGVARLREAIA